MELSRLIAKIICLIYLSSSLGGFLNKDYYRSISDDFYNNTGLVYIGGVLAVITGAIMMNYHNVWVTDWRVLITIFGWITFGKGVFLLAFSKSVQNLTVMFLTDRFLRIIPYVTLLIGLLFGYFGFFSR